MVEESARAKSPDWSGDMPASFEGRRERIIQAFIQTSMESGLQKASIAEVARTAGVTRPTLYKYFANIRVLYQAAVQHIFIEAARSAAESIRGLEDLDQQLLTIIQLQNETLKTDSVYSRFLSSIVTSHRPDLINQEDSAAMLRDILAISLQPVFNQHPHLESKREALLDWFGRMSIAMVVNPYSDDSDIKQAIDLVIHGL